MLSRREQLLSRRGTIAVTRRRVAVAVPQVEDRVGRKPDTGHPADERGHVGQRNALGATFGEVTAERVVEAARRCGSLAAQSVRGGSVFGPLA